MDDRKQEDHEHAATSPGEILKLLGVMRLMTRVTFGSRHDLWECNDNDPVLNILGVPKFGEIMSRNRFKQSRSCIVFSTATTGHGEETSRDETMSEAFR